MSTKLIHSNLWASLTAYAKKAKKAHVAVAYFGSGAARQLPLKAGSVLVVDLSEKAVKAGLTNPYEVSKLLNRGVKVHSVENLHAKVFVFDRRAIVGSPNVSESSRTRLLEAALETTDKETIKSTKEFVLSLMGDPIGPEALSKLSEMYSPPKIKGGQHKKSAIIKPKHSSLWIFPLTWVDYDEETKAISIIEKTKAEKKISDNNKYVVDEFLWMGKRGYENIRIHQRALAIEYDSTEGAYLVPPSRIIHIKRWRRGTKYLCLIYTERPTAMRRMGLSKAIAKLGDHSQVLNKVKADAKLLNDPVATYQIGQLWTKQY